MANEAAVETQVIASTIRAVEGFTGREAELTAIDTALWQKGGRAVLVSEGAAGQGLDPAAAHRLGGVGKSVIAREYAWRNRERYAGVWWARGETRETLLNDIVDLGAHLMQGLEGVPNRARAAAATLDVITQMHSAKPWLIVYDDVAGPDDIARLTPAGNAHVLITSRWSDGQGEAQEIAIGAFPRPTAVEYLLERARQPDAHAAGRLADAFGCLPLALALARATCWTTGLGFDAYREKLPDLIKNSPLPTPVFASVGLALERAIARCPKAEVLLGIAAHLAPDRIPLEIVTADLMSVSEREEAAAALAEVSLAERETLDDGMPAISVHRLVQEAMRGRPLLAPSDSRSASRPEAASPSPHGAKAEWGEGRGEGQPQGTSSAAAPHPNPLPASGEWEYIALATRLMALAYPAGEIGPDDVRTWPRCRLLEPHVGAVLAIAPNDGAHASHTLLLLNQYVLHLKARAEYAAAEPHLRRALEIEQSLHGTEHPGIAAHLGNLAALLQATNRLTEAEPVVRRALGIAEAHLGPDHPDVADGLSTLAQLLHRTDRAAEAEPLMRRALRIDENAHGPDHPAVARDLGHLARLLQDTSRLDESEPLYRRALAIDEEIHGPEHPTVGIRLNNLAGLLQETDRLAEAEPLLRRAVSIFERRLGDNHPDTAISLDNLAELLRITNRPAEAEPLMRRVLDIDEQIYGPDHPALARDLNDLAVLLQNMSQAADAEPLARRAMHIMEASLGPDHPDSKALRANHASIMEVVKAVQDRLDADEAKRLGKYKAAHASPYPVTHIPVPEASNEERGPGFLGRLFGRR
jgi:tetratricopeptide (TPR) repeat protein